MDDCLDDYIESQLNCSLPWRREMNETDNVGLCDQPWQLELYLNLSKELMVQGENKLASTTGCETSCVRDNFVSSMVSSSESRATDSSVTKSTLELRWEYDQADFPVKKQYLTYDGNDFIADFGGYLGLLLGHSLLTFYDGIVACIERASKLRIIAPKVEPRKA